MRVDLDMTICGVECIVRVYDWEPYRPGYIGGPPENCYPAEGGYGDWEICDKSGNPAPELEQQMTAIDREKLELALFDYMESRHV